MTPPAKTAWSGWLAIATGLILSTAIAAQSWVRVRLHRDRHIDVTGSAKRRIVSDLIQWQANISTEDKDRTAAYKALREHVARTLAYLRGPRSTGRHKATAESSSAPLSTDPWPSR